MNEYLNFGQAIEALKQGKRIARKGWNGNGMFVFMRPADETHMHYTACYLHGVFILILQYEND